MKLVPILIVSFRLERGGQFESGFQVIITPVTQEPELLFQKDGCSTYAYYDKGTRHRYTTCENNNEESRSKIAPNT